MLPRRPCGYAEVSFDAPPGSELNCADIVAPFMLADRF
jgi:hypothetical protein